MRELPLGHPGTPDLRSPTRFLVWVARGQLGTLALGMAYGVVWMGALAVVPALVGRAIDLGVAEGDTAGLLRWSALILAAGLVSAIAGILRHRVAVVNWLTATYRVQQLLVRQAVRLGAALPRQVPTGEVAAVGSHDAERVGAVMDILARLAGALVSFVVVAALMLRSSTTLGLLFHAAEHSTRHIGQAITTARNEASVVVGEQTRPLARTEKAIQRLAVSRCAGGQFDPVVARVFADER